MGGKGRKVFFVSVGCTVLGIILVGRLGSKQIQGWSLRVYWSQVWRWIICYYYVSVRIQEVVSQIIQGEFLEREERVVGDGVLILRIGKGDFIFVFLVVLENYYLC